MMAQCEHDFQVDPKDGQVKCTKCGDLDDEMQLTNPGLEREEEEGEEEEREEFGKSQVTFE